MVEHRTGQAGYLLGRDSQCKKDRTILASQSKPPCSCMSLQANCKVTVWGSLSFHQARHQSES